MRRKEERSLFMVFLLAALVMIPCVTATAAATTLTGADIDAAIYQTVDHYAGEGAPGEEWVVFALNAAGEDVNKTPYLSDGDSFFDGFDIGDSPTINDYAKAILAFESIGEDSGSFVGGLAACERSGIVYINTAAYALIALDAAAAPDSSTDSINRDYLISYILDNKIGVNGAWGYSWDGVDYEDIDTTAQMILALAPYYDGDTDVQSSVDEALEWLAAQDCGSNSSSCSQAICALTALGLDPQDWCGSNLVQELLSYQLSDGRFSFYGSANAMSTYQALAALAAVKDYLAGGSSDIYQNISYHESEIITLRIEDASSTVLSWTSFQSPVGADLAEVAVLAAAREGLMAIGLDAIGNIVNPDSGDLYHAVINGVYIGDAGSSFTPIAAGDDILLYTGAEGARIGKVALTNSINNNNNLVSTEDYVTATVEAMSNDGSWAPVSGATVYADDNAVGTTDAEGQVTFNIGTAGSHEVWAGALDLSGDTMLVKTLPQRAEVAENVVITFRMEGARDSENYPDGTVVPLMSVKVPEGASTIFAVKRALDLAGIDNTIDINNYITPTDISLPDGVTSPGYMYQVNDSLDWIQTVGEGDSVVLYMSYYDPDTWAAITSYARISADKTQINPGDTVVLTVEKSDGGWPASYMPAQGAEVYIDGSRLEDGGGNAILTDSNGQVQVSLNEARKYSIHAEQYDTGGIPLIVKTGVLTVSSDLKIEFIDTPASFAKGGDADVTVKINNASASDITGLLIVALYDTGKNQMVNYSYVSQTVAAAGSEEFTAGFAIPATGNYQVRVFVWDGWDSALPLSDSLIIPVE